MRTTEVDLMSGKGKKPYQRLKPYLVLQYLLQASDENHVVPSAMIVDYLKENGIYAERRSIYQDIREINYITLMRDEDCTLEEAIAAIEENEELQLVVYDASRKGFYVKQRNYTFHDIQLLTECIYSARFLSSSQAKLLADVVGRLVSDDQAKQIRHDALLTDRVKTNNKEILANIGTINDAMSKERDGRKHQPEQISFQYLSYSIHDVHSQVERKHGGQYLVSPYKLLITDGNYYLLAYDGKRMRTYRVDRMKRVRLTGEPRTGEDVFKEIDLRTYTKRVFGMFSGNEKRVTIRFINPLLDTAVDRFGNDSDVLYQKADDRHFTVTAPIEVSDQFFGWLTGFGRRAKILYPAAVAEEYRQYLDKIREMYD